MTDLVERLREREAMATPGPWELQDGNSHRRIGVPGKDGSVCRPAKYSEREPHWLTLDGERVYADLMLAVEARNALPELLDRIQADAARLEKAREALEIVANRPIQLSDIHSLNEARETAREALKELSHGAP